MLTIFLSFAKLGFGQLAWAIDGANIRKDEGTQCFLFYACPFRINYSQVNNVILTKLLLRKAAKVIFSLTSLCSLFVLYKNIGGEYRGRLLMNGVY